MVEAICYTEYMFSHASEDYKCPICLGIEGIENEDTLLKQADLIYKDKLTSVFINSFFLKGNEGHLIVVPNQHQESIYNLTHETSAAIMDTTQAMAKLLKQAYDCDGITLRQNNEPAGDQHAFHFHLQIFPRYTGDHFNQAERYLSTPDERQKYYDKLRSHLS
jgi:histidine triad (HIT) family protein